jgi:hypothetical protein
MAYRVEISGSKLQKKKSEFHFLPSSDVFATAIIPPSETKNTRSEIFGFLFSGAYPFGKACGDD